MARVLLVEDERSLREVVAEALQDSGHEAEAAENGVQALEKLNSEEFDVVISDITMPQGVSGIDVANYLESRSPLTRVILVSGHARAQLGAMPNNVTFLPKPYRIRQILELLKPL